MPVTATKYPAPNVTRFGEPSCGAARSQLVPSVERQKASGPVATNPPPPNATPERYVGHSRLTEAQSQPLVETAARVFATATYLPLPKATDCKYTDSDSSVTTSVNFHCTPL